MMPVFFLSTGLRTEWTLGGAPVFVAAGALLVAAVAGKLLGTRLAGRILRWPPGEASLVGWLLQTKALIMIIFANVLLDKGIITATTFTALLLFAVAAWALRQLVVRLPQRDRWYVGLVWLALCGLGADWSGLHFMVGAFLSGAVMDRDWFDHDQLDALRRDVLLLMMPVFFLSTGLRTEWTVGGAPVFLAAGALLVAAVAGKLLGVRLAGRILRWPPGESALVGWLLQTKALIMIIFANVLLDKGVITATTFTALLLMAVASTMLTVPMATPLLARLRGPGHRSS
jgi:Kef-type K+ transport system membrane component KefB